MSETEQHNVQQSVQQGAQENLGAHRDAHHAQQNSAQQHSTQQHGTQQHGAQPSPSVRFTNATVTRGHRVIWTDGNFSIPRGTVTAIVGTNGAGKTTLLDVELGLLHLSNGSVEVLSLPAGKANEKIGYVPQNYASDIDSNITAEQSVRLGLDGTRFGIHRMSDQQRDKITQALQLAGIENHRKLRLSEMSGGMRQRVAIAQALVSDPELLLLDEPLANLDIAGQRDLVDVLAHLAEDLGMTIQIVAHDLNVLLPILTGAIYLLDGHPHYAPIGHMMDSELLTHLYGTKVEVLKTVQGDMFVRPDPHVEPENRPIHTHTPAEAARFHSDNKPADDNARQMEVR